MALLGRGHCRRLKGRNFQHLEPIEFTADGDIRPLTGLGAFNLNLLSTVQSNTITGNFESKLDTATHGVNLWPASNEVEITARPAPER